MLTLKARGSDGRARDAYNGLANSPVSQLVSGAFLQILRNQNLTAYHADVRPSRALTMERLADCLPTCARK